MDYKIEQGLSKWKENIGFYCSQTVGYPLTVPDHVYFSLTKRCNLQCPMCSIETRAADASAKGELSTKKIKDIILEIKDLGIKQLIFSGGEPLLRHDLLELVDFAVSSGIKIVAIITNGQLLNDKLMQDSIKCQLAHITFSIDGMRETHDSIRGQGTFDRAVCNIDRFNYFKANTNSALPILGISFTIMDNNIDDILPMIDFAKTKKCDSVVLKPVVLNSNNIDKNISDAFWLKQDNIEKLKNILEKVQKIKRSYDKPVICTDENIFDQIPRFFQGQRIRGQFKCYEAIKRIVIDCAGALLSCKGRYGDLRKQSLKQAWFSEKARQIRILSGVCKQHCLQDCVFSPSDITNDTQKLLRTLQNYDSDTRKTVEAQLIEKIDNLLASLPHPTSISYMPRRKTDTDGQFEAIKQMIYNHEADQEGKQE